jgi:formate/nitrite transporter
MTRAMMRSPRAPRAARARATRPAATTSRVVVARRGRALAPTDAGRLDVGTARARATPRAGVVVRAEGLAPPAVFDAACAASEKKGAQTPRTTLVMGFAAGALIGIGALLMTCVGGASPTLAMNDPGMSALLKGAIGLPAGLTMVILTGAELFTGNVFVMLSGWLSGRATERQVARSWALSYVGNFVGAVFMAYMACAAMTAATPAASAAAVGIATAKASLPFAAAFVKGVLCNWLVCLAVWGTMATTSVAGKVLAIFWPITTFVALGFEHSVANMFLIPHGMLLGANVSWAQMMTGNIIPVTLGNIVGAAVFVAGVHWLAYGKK